MSDALKVCIFCGSKPGKDSEFAAASEKLGSSIGQLGFEMVFGGGSTGLMGITSQAALKAGAKVHGIIPEFLVPVEQPKTNLTTLKVTKSMAERKDALIKSSDMIVVQPGGIGTIEEVFEALADNLLGIYQKPIGFLNVNGYFDGLFDFLNKAVAQGFIKSSGLWIQCSDPEILLLQLKKTVEEIKAKEG